MAERAAVTDTHALLYHAEGGRRLGSQAAAYFAAASEGRALVYVPMAVAIELILLNRMGRAGLRVSPAEFFTTLLLNPAFQLIDLTIDQIVAASELRFNRDPYDALIVAAASSLDLPLLTRDLAIVESGAVKVIW